MSTMDASGDPNISRPFTKEQLAHVRLRTALPSGTGGGASISDAGAGASAPFLDRSSPSPRPSHSPSPSPSPSQRQDSLSGGVYMPKSADYDPRDTIPNTPLAASVISAALGAVLGAALFAAAGPVWRTLGTENWAWARPQLGIYVGSWAVFHLLEYWTTAGWNYRKLSVDAFLLNNTSQYHIAHLVGLAEYFITSFFFPSKFEQIWASVPVLAIFTGLLIAGQAFRSLAMIHAGRSFSHLVKDTKLDDHALVTTGVYSIVRHPSYVGFFYWAVATQLLLSNVVSTVGFIIVLGRFFSGRIRGEEVYLVRFFGDDYIRYRKRVGSGLPFLVK